MSVNDDNNEKAKEMKCEKHCKRITSTLNLPY